MSITTIQIPVDKELKRKATLAAREMGFSSLQELLRVFLAQFVLGRINISLFTKEIKEFQKNERNFEK